MRRAIINGVLGSVYGYFMVKYGLLTRPLSFGLGYCG